MNDTVTSAHRRSHRVTLLAATALVVVLAGCSGGNRPSDEGTGLGAAPCSGRCQDVPTRLTVADVGRVIAQGVAEAQARNAPATLGVVDRVGNVLGVYRMAGAPLTLDIDGGLGASGGLDGVQIVPSELGTIAKALTAAYFSSEGNAFTTRTANQIIQEHFNPGEFNTPGGPLFGVQISQLPCSDISRRFNGVGPDPGPHRSPIGFAADPGGLPLYKNGTLVGAVGVIAREPDGRGLYTLDRVLTDTDTDIDELVATAATHGFAAPRDRRADVITVEGKLLRFADVDFGDLRSDPAQAPAFNTLPPGLLAIIGYTVAAAGDAPPPLRAGTAFGHPDSGVRPATVAEFPASLDAFVLVDETNANRFPARDGIGGLASADVQRLLEKSIELANRTRSQVRRPLGSPAGIHVVVVDTNGDVLGAARTRDALIDAVDVTVQKARTSVFLSSADAADALRGVPAAAYLAPGSNLQVLRSSPVAPYVDAYRDFLDLPQGLADGGIAWSTRAVGNISRPFFPDNIDGNRPGPLSKPDGEWSIFSTGLELDLVYNAVVRHLAFVFGVLPTDVDQSCTGYAGLDDGFAVSGQFAQLRNGMTLFAGGFPIYRGDTLIGAIGLSGDGLEQDEFLPFLAVDRVGTERGTLNNAPAAKRADRLRVDGVNLRYAICPQTPFLDSDQQRVCDGL